MAAIIADEAPSNRRAQREGADRAALDHRAVHGEGPGRSLRLDDRPAEGSHDAAGTSRRAARRGRASRHGEVLATQVAGDWRCGSGARYPRSRCGCAPPYTSSAAFKPLVTDGGFQGAPAWSPDGKTLAYVAPVDGILQVFTRSEGSGQAGAPIVKVMFPEIDRLSREFTLARRRSDRRQRGRRAQGCRRVLEDAAASTARDVRPTRTSRRRVRRARSCRRHISSTRVAGSGLPTKAGTRRQMRRTAVRS